MIGAKGFPLPIFSLIMPWKGRPSRVLAIKASLSHSKCSMVRGHLAGLTDDGFESISDPTTT